MEPPELREAIMDPMMMAIGDSIVSIFDIEILKIRKCRYYPY